MPRCVPELVSCAIVASLVACSSGSSEPQTADPQHAQRQANEEPGATENATEERQVAAPPTFEHMRVVMNESPCPPQARGDCESAFELRADGTTRIDPWGEPGERFEGTVRPAVVREAAASLASPELTRLLDRGCDEQHPSEEVFVRAGGQDHHGQTGHCNEDAVQSMREAMSHVTDEAYPGHSLISPPF